MKKTLLLSTAIVLFSLIFFAGVCVAGGAVTKPLKIMWTGTAYVVGLGSPYEGCDGEIRVVNTGTGVSTLSGQCEWFSVYCGTYDKEGNFEGTGWGIVTAANGDKGYAEIELNLSARGEISQTETFIGGTGRFEGMSGNTSSTGTITGPGTFPYTAPVHAQLLDYPSNWQATSVGTYTLNPGSH